MNIDALQSSWRYVERAGDEATQYFYAHLFLAHPEVRDMFPIRMTAQRAKFFSALGRIVSNVTTLADDPEFVAQLGRDHRRFGVIADHYPAAGGSLLATLAHFLGPRWTDELAQTWTAAYFAVADIMTAAASAAEHTPAWWDAEIVATERRSVDVTVHTVRPQQSYEYQAGQSLAVEIPQRPRLWRYYSPANAPRPDGTFELHVQVVDGGEVSATFARQVRPGDQIRLGSPVGTAFNIPPDAVENLLLVAGGSGLAPLRAVVDRIDQNYRDTGHAPRVQLFHGVRTAWNLYDHEALSALTERPWFSYTPVVSEDPSFQGVHGAVGAVAARGRDLAGCTALVCGSPAMVSAGVSALSNAGLPRHAIRFETFGQSHHPAGTAEQRSGDKVAQWM
ncbi:FAD-binding oxidoreductase [Nocardia huaxiensis]|uniref:nitric oxide dioxygenase n=1 Tax=Nocardia huaxiensis TaxID=2755382 RepID=A0A7D6ZVY4_9NOCA|nr:FAD-binding oxidoreductase [Nocardia huaxiensis]QLY29989.1 oxidoreductase [Nocardia huaxiensis]UFS96424.1 FAD-binding oxidoreductase [Nocardia huaxiensis]